MDTSIDGWVVAINEIYERSNCERSFDNIIGYFNEDVGRCFQLINRKREAEIENLLPSIFRWFCALSRKKVDQSVLVSDLLWNKFPGICPYCKQKTCQCRIGKEKLDVQGLRLLADKDRDRKPTTINEWQTHFQKIYPRGAESSFMINVSHLAEESAELREAYRKKHVKKDIPCVEMELADVFSWIMGLANLTHQLNDAKRKGGKFRLGDVIAEKYKNGCPDCLDLRKEYKIDYCCCSIKEQKFELISEYENDEESDEPEILNSGGTTVGVELKF